jgi:hypothetical protein
MTQRDQNGNCFCSKAAMRQQQSLTIFRDTLFALVTSQRSSLGDVVASQPRDPQLMLGGRLQANAARNAAQRAL